MVCWIWIGENTKKRILSSRFLYFLFVSFLFLSIPLFSFLKSGFCRSSTHFLYVHLILFKLSVWISSLVFQQSFFFFLLMNSKSRLDTTAILLHCYMKVHFEHWNSLFIRCLACHQVCLFSFDKQFFLWKTFTRFELWI